MSTQARVTPDTNPRATSVDLGAKLVALSGVGAVGYGVAFLVRNFTGFIELGLTPAHVGSTPEQIQAFSPKLFAYISHLHVNLAGLAIALGLTIIGLAWFGIRAGQRWALWTAFGAPVVYAAVGLPIHYPYGLATVGHVGLVYLSLLLLVVGTVLSYKAMKA